MLSILETPSRGWAVVRTLTNLIDEERALAAMQALGEMIGDHTSALLVAREEELHWWRPSAVTNPGLGLFFENVGPRTNIYDGSQTMPDDQDDRYGWTVSQGEKPVGSLVQISSPLTRIRGIIVAAGREEVMQRLLRFLTRSNIPR